jgi:AcrR family transcriptional regulator
MDSLRTVPENELIVDLKAVAPRPLLSRTAERKLGARHKEVLDRLEYLLLSDGFAQFTITDLAAGVSCSRRTLYEISASKEQLVLVVLDRYLHRKGRAALAAIDPNDSTVEQLRTYITTGGIGPHLQNTAYDDLTEEPAARRLLDHHYRFTMTVIERLLETGMNSGELRPLNASVVAASVAGACLYLSQPDVVDDIGEDRAEITAAMLDYLLPSLAATERL